MQHYIIITNTDSIKIIINSKKDIQSIVFSIILFMVYIVLFVILFDYSIFSIHRIYSLNLHELNNLIYLLLSPLIVFLVLWLLVGKEEVILKNSKLILKRTIFGIGQCIKMDILSVKKIRFNKLYEISPWSFWGLGKGKVIFDYGMDSHSFGLALLDSEAYEIIELLKKHVISN